MLCYSQGGGGTRIPHQGLEGGGPAEGRKKKSDLTDFDGGMVVDVPKGTSDGSTGVQVEFELR